MSCARYFFLMLLGVWLPSASLARDWSWALVQAGSNVGVTTGRAEVDKAADKLRAKLYMGAPYAGPGDLPSVLEATMSQNQISGILTINPSDAGPMLLENGRWIVHKLDGGYAIETVWLHDPHNGHYLVLTRWVDKK